MKRLRATSLPSQYNLLEMNLPTPTKRLTFLWRKTGTWAEVTVPYVDIYLDGTDAKSPRLKEMVKPRFYFSQVVWLS